MKVKIKVIDKVNVLAIKNCKNCNVCKAKMWKSCTKLCGVGGDKTCFKYCVTAVKNKLCDFLSFAKTNKPAFFSAWDVEQYFLVRVIQSGPLKLILKDVEVFFINKKANFVMINSPTERSWIF